MYYILDDNIASSSSGSENSVNIVLVISLTLTSAQDASSMYKYGKCQLEKIYRTVMGSINWRQKVDMPVARLTCKIKQHYFYIFTL